jgi:putative transposase
MITEKAAGNNILTKSELCDALGIPRSSYYRLSNVKKDSKKKRKESPRKLSKYEEERVLSVLNSERFCDMAPGEIYSTLLDEGAYYCSERTMYRILSKNNQNHQRRQREAFNYQRPELLTTGVNQLWSWDITKLKGPKKWTYYYLYKIMDVYSRYVALSAYISETNLVR